MFPCMHSAWLACGVDTSQPINVRFGTCLGNDPNHRPHPNPAQDCPSGFSQFGFHCTKPCGSRGMGSRGMGSRVLGQSTVFGPGDLGGPLEGPGYACQVHGQGWNIVRGLGPEDSRLGPGYTFVRGVWPVVCGLWCCMLVGLAQWVQGASTVRAGRYAAQHGTRQDDVGLHVGRVGVCCTSPGRSAPRRRKASILLLCIG